MLTQSDIAYRFATTPAAAAVSNSCGRWAEWTGGCPTHGACGTWIERHDLPAGEIAAAAARAADEGVR